MKETYRYAELKYVEIELNRLDIIGMLQSAGKVPRDFGLERIEMDEEAGTILVVMRREQPVEKTNYE